MNDALPDAALVLIPGGGGELVYVLGPCGLLKWALPRDGQFILLLYPLQVYTARGYEVLIFQQWDPGLYNLSWAGIACFPVILPGFYVHINVGLPGLLAALWLPVLSAPTAHLCPSCQSG